MRSHSVLGASLLVAASVHAIPRMPHYYGLALAARQLDSADMSSGCSDTCTTAYADVQDCYTNGSDNDDIVDCSCSEDVLNQLSECITCGNAEMEGRDANLDASFSDLINQCEAAGYDASTFLQSSMSASGSGSASGFSGSGSSFPFSPTSSSMSPEASSSTSDSQSASSAVTGAQSVDTGDDGEDEGEDSDDDSSAAVLSLGLISSAVLAMFGHLLALA